MEKSKFIVALLMGFFLVPQLSFAESLGTKIKRLEEKITKLEEANTKSSNLETDSDLEVESLGMKITSLEEKIAKLEAEKPKPGILENVSISGLIEIDAVSVKDDQAALLVPPASRDTSDITLSTVELGIDAKVNDNVEGHILFLYEDDEDVVVDEGTITITSDYGISLTAGKMYVPFGMFNSHFITDPMTLDLGETRETAVVLGYSNDVFELSVGVYNGDVDEFGDEDEIGDVVASLTISPVEGFTIGASYISDMADTDNDITGAAGAALPVADTNDAYSAFLSATLGPLTLELEHLSAVEDFQIADFDANTDGLRDRPSATNVELALAIGDKSEVAVRWEESDEAGSFEDRMGIAASCEVLKGTTVIFEYMSAEYDDDSGDDYDTITAELAIEF
ncbi:MAG: LbtU family siderophore porin [Proteobacteria bacterium]|nr:LbtU family siderophore porin [Pseudomonadota bacterium]